MLTCYKKIDNYILETSPSENTKGGERTVDIQITFLCDKEFFANSMQYKNVPLEKVQYIKEELDKYTQANANTPKGVAVCFSFLDMIREISEILY